MSNVTADAPVRANKAPARAKSAPAPTPRGEPDPSPKWLELGLLHTRRLSDLLYTLVDAEAKAQGLIQDLVESAEANLQDLVSDESSIDVGADGALYFRISTVVVMLEAAWYASEHGPLDYPPDLHAVVIPAAITYAQGLAHALQEAPLTDRFEALAQPRTVAGARPHRDRPQPPIRRIEEQAEDLMQQAIMFGDLVQWIMGARDTLEKLGWAVAANTPLKDELRRHDVPYGYPEWGIGLASEGVDWLLNEQHVTIKALGAKAGAA